MDATAASGSSTFICTHTHAPTRTHTHAHAHTHTHTQVETAHSHVSKPSPLTTKELVTKETARVGSALILNPGYSRDDEHYRLMCELSAAKSRAEKMEAKLRKIRELVEKAEKDGSDTLQVGSLLCVCVCVFVSVYE